MIISLLMSTLTASILIETNSLIICLRVNPYFSYVSRYLMLDL